MCGRHSVGVEWALSLHRYVGHKGHVHCRHVSLMNLLCCSALKSSYFHHGASVEASCIDDTVHWESGASWLLYRQLTSENARLETKPWAV